MLVELGPCRTYSVARAIQPAASLRPIVALAVLLVLVGFAKFVSAVPALEGPAASSATASSTRVIHDYRCFNAALADESFHYCISGTESFVPVEIPPGLGVSQVSSVGESELTVFTDVVAETDTTAEHRHRVQGIPVAKESGVDI